MFTTKVSKIIRSVERAREDRRVKYPVVLIFGNLVDGVPFLSQAAE